MSIATHTEDNPSVKITSERKKRNLIVLSVALFPLVFSTVVFSLVVLLGNIQFPEKIGSKSELGEIILPIDKSTIPKKFSISGTIENVPDDSFLYLIESRDKQFWPKLAIGNKEKTWKKELTAHGKKNQFYSFLLVKVDGKGKQELDKWFKTSRETGKYPGLTNINFAEAIAKIRVKTK